MNEQKVTILMVDDKVENLTALEAVIGGPDRELIKAHSGEEAIRHLLKTDFDLILLDIRMPDMTGFEVAELVRRRVKTKDIPIFFLTAEYKDFSNMMTGYELGAIDYIMKPFNPVILRAKVERILELQKAKALLRVQARLLAESEERLEGLVRVRTEELERKNSLLEEEVALREKSERTISSQYRILQGVYGILRESLTCETVEEVAGVFLSAAEAATGSAMGFVGILNEKGNMDTIAMSALGRKACTLEGAGENHVIRDMSPRGIWGKVIREGVSFYTNDPASHPDAAGTPLGHPPVKAFLGVPLRRGGVSVSGMIGLANKEQGYGAEDQETVEKLSQIFLEALTRKGTEIQLSQQFQRMSLLHDIVKAMQERFDMESTATIVLDRLEKDLAADLACLLLKTNGDDHFRVVQVGGHGRRIASSMDLEIGGVIPIEESGLQETKADQVIVEQGIDGMQGAVPAMLKQAGMRSLVKFTLWVGNSSIGLMFLADRRNSAFSSRDCAFLRQLSEHLAMAVHQRNLFIDLQKAYEDLRLTQQLAMEQERLRAMGQMASGIAHDINNALGPIMVYSEMLLEGEKGLSEKSRRFIETIRSAADDISHTVDRMRQFYKKKEEGEELGPVDLNKIVEQVIALARPKWFDMAQKKGVAIDMRMDFMEDLPRINGVENEIREALTNLIFNAVDAMPEGGTLTVRTRREDGLGLVEVMDTGIGMDQETRERCMEPFFSTKKERGTGLGLAMVYGMIQRHGGRIEIQSQPGKGTTAALFFQEAPSCTRPARVEETTAPVGPLHILCVDDEPHIREALKDALGADGHRVGLAAGGEEGIRMFMDALARGDPFDVVITDLGMPHVDGRKVADAVKEVSQGTPVIMLTGWGKTIKAEGEMPKGVDRILPKPPRIKELSKALVDLTGKGEHGSRNAERGK